MGFSSLSGRARTSSRNPQAFGVCDRCGIWYNHSSLRWQFDWAGASLINKRILVCNPCYDTPQNQLRAIILPADPVPILNPRTEPAFNDEVDYRVVSGPVATDPTTGLQIPGTLDQRATQNNSTRVTQETGNPTGLQAGAVMPLQETVTYGTLLPVMSISANGTTIITVTCSAVHGLSTNDQVSVSGSAVSSADGFFSVTVTSATAFTYEVNAPISSGLNPLYGATTRVITVIVGLPYDLTQIPKTGV